MSEVKDFIIQVETADAIRVSGRGIAHDKGGTIIDRFPFRYPHTPVYIALESVQSSYPKHNCRVIFK